VHWLVVIPELGARYAVATASVSAVSLNVSPSFRSSERRWPHSQAENSKICQGRVSMTVRACVRACVCVCVCVN